MTRDLEPHEVPPVQHNRITGFTVQLSEFGYHIHLTYGQGSLVSTPFWALTWNGAHRKGRRLVARERRREDLRDCCTWWDA